MRRGELIRAVAGNPGRGWPHRRVSAIAAQQRTLVRHDQLVALGVGKSAIGRALSDGRLYWVHRGVYSVVEPKAWPPLTREHAAVLVCGERSYLSHRSAAAVWGIRPQATGRTDVTLVGRDAGRTRAGIRIHRVKTLNPLDTRKFGGIPITSPARTLLDVAPHLNDRELEKAFDEAIATELVTIAAVRSMLLANPRRPGWRRVYELAHADRKPTMTRSEGEEAMLKLIRRAGLPDPEVNARLGRWTVDFLWRAERLVVEVDGHPYHSSRAARERDHRKDAELQQAGFVVIRITGRRLKYAAEEVLAQVAAALALRGAA
jgi:very-short-patch-repair endonuclease